MYSYDFNNEIIVRKYIYRRRYKYIWKFETIYSMKKIDRKFIMFKKIIDTYILEYIPIYNWKQNIYIKINKNKNPRNGDLVLNLKLINNNNDTFERRTMS